MTLQKTQDIKKSHLCTIFAISFAMIVALINYSSDRQAHLLLPKSNIQL